MKMKLVGIQRVDYTNKAGKHVLGHSLHVMHPSKNVDGEAAESIYVSDASEISVIDKLKPGMSIDVSYNRFGGVDDVLIQ